MQKKAARSASGPAAAKVGAPTPAAIVEFVASLAEDQPLPARPMTFRKPSPVIEPALEPAPEPAAQLPEAYGTRQLHLVARDTRWLYAHWDFTREQQRELNELAPVGHLSVRIYKDSPDSRFVQQVELAPESRHWFFPVGYGETNYVASLGYEDRRHQWVSVVVSNVATTPPDTLARDRSVVFATIPMHTTFAQIRQVLDTGGPGSAPLIESIRRYAEAGQATASMPASVTAPEAPWTLEKTLRLARVMGIESILRRMRSDLSSLVFANILPPESATWPELVTNWDYEPFGSSEFSGPAWSGELAGLEK